MKLPAWSIQEGKGNLEIRFRHGGKFRALSSGTRSRREAESCAPALIGRWLVSRTPATSQTAWDKAMESFHIEEYGNQKETTWEGVRTILRRLAKCFSDLEGPHQLTAKIFRSRLKAYKGTAAPKYWAEILSITRKYCTWATAQGIMGGDATKGIPYPSKSEFGRREAIWTEEYFEQVIGIVTAADAERLLIMRWSGMDSGDVKTFDPAKHLTKDEEGHPVLKKRREKGKSNEETIIQPLFAKIIPFMGKRHGEGYASIRSFTSSLRGRVQRAMESAGLPVMDLKSLRHTFATYHAERGVPLDVLRAWLGHARASRTLDRYYIHRRSTARYMN